MVAYQLYIRMFGEFKQFHEVYPFYRGDFLEVLLYLSQRNKYNRGLEWKLNECKISALACSLHKRVNVKVLIDKICR